MSDNIPEVRSTSNALADGTSIGKDNEALDDLMFKLGERGVMGIYRSDARAVLKQCHDNVERTIQTLVETYVEGSELSTDYSSSAKDMSDAMKEVMQYLPPKVRLPRAEEYLPPPVKVHRITKEEVGTVVLSRAAKQAHRLPPSESRQITHVLDRLKNQTSNAQLRELKEAQGRADLLPGHLSRAQACAILRTVDNPDRRAAALDVLAPRLDSDAQKLHAEIRKLIWPNDIKELCGDPAEN